MIKLSCGFGCFIVVTLVVQLGSLANVGARVQIDPDPGRTTFLDNGCARCHAVETQNIEATVSIAAMRGPDLGRIGSDRDAKWLAAYLKREETVNGTRHRVPYSGSDHDLGILSEWLAGLR